MDVRAKTITNPMVIDAAKELANFAKEKGISKDYVIPTMVQWEVFARVAAKVGQAVIREGVARRKLSAKESLVEATKTIEHSRKIVSTLREGGNNT